MSTQPVAYAELPHAQHAFEVLRSVRGIHTTRAIARFLDVVRARSSTTAGLASIAVDVVVVDPHPVHGGGGEQLGESAGESGRQFGDVGEHVGARDDAELHVVAATDRSDVERDALDERTDGVQTLEPRSAPDTAARVVREPS